RYALLAALIASGCDCTGSVSTTTAPCADPRNPPTACGRACSTSNLCPSGFYCSTAGGCTADCDATHASCHAPATCMPDGHCSGGAMTDGSMNMRDGRVASGCSNIPATVRDFDVSHPDFED